MDAIENDRDALVETFLAETDEQLREMEQAAIALEAQPDDPEALQTIFRAAHTLKGNAASLGLIGVAELAHALENLLHGLRTQTVAVSARVVTLLLRAVDALRALTPEATAGRMEVHPQQAALLASLGEVAPADPGTAGLDEAVPSAGAAVRGRHTLRVDLGRLDRMLDLSGEIAVALGRLAQVLRASATGAELHELYREADRIFLDLQEEILCARMVPLGPAFRQQVRTVRDASQSLGKLARLELEGEDVEVDTTLVEQLRGPITHMVRNAVDHGIERPEVRAERGKDPHGRIVLSARHEAGGVVIELADDGGGLDRTRLEARAHERGLAVDAHTPDEELFGLVFAPGFSTSNSVTELSGRGIGMDVVRHNVEALRGSVDVRSTPGAGATFRIRVPLTVAIIQGFLVEAAGETYVIPLEAVSECLDLGTESGCDERHGVVNLRGEAVPFTRLRQAFGAAPAAGKRECLVVVAHGGRRFGLAVDALLGETQVVIKPFGRPLEHVPGIAGATILGSGRVSLILDVPALMESARKEPSREARESA